MRGFLQIHVLLLFFVSSFVCFSQTKQYIDSVETLLKKEPNEKEKAKLLSKLAWAYQQTNPEKSISYASQSISLADEIHDTTDKAWATKAMGWALYHKNKFSESISFFENAFSLSVQIKDTALQDYSLQSLVSAFVKQGKYADAMQIQMNRLNIHEKNKDTFRICAAMTGIATLFTYQHRYERALEYFNQTLDLALKINNEILINDALSNVALMYTSLGKDKEALKYYNQLLKIYQASGSKASLASNYLNTGVCYFNMSGYLNAKSNYEKALPIFEELKDDDNATICYMNLAEVCSILGDLENAARFGKRAVALATQMNNKDNLKDAYLYLSAVYEKQKKYKEAYENHQLYSQLKDSLLNEESSKQITEMQTKYETEKKEQQITLLNKDKELQDAQLNRQKIIIWSVAGGLLVVLTLSIFIFRERKKSEKLLLNILPVETAKELKRNGKATPRYYESVTVMFTDFMGFTTIAEKLSAEELVSELDFLFKKFDEIISKYNIEKIKTIGDAYMCASGLPIPNNNHAENIVNAAIEIQNWMNEQNNKWKLRIGIHSGPVTAGVVGDKKFAYDIWGDTVNTASRMESSGEPDKINISGATRQLINNKFSCEFRGKIPAKNKGEIEMYFVGLGA